MTVKKLEYRIYVFKNKKHPNSHYLEIINYLHFTLPIILHSCIYTTDKTLYSLKEHFKTTWN